MENTQYKKFALMLAMSAVIMYAVMFLNVDEPSHIYLSLTRLYMTLLMVGPMAIVMLAMMPTMYNNRRRNSIIYLVSVAVFVFALLSLRRQIFVGDSQYMKAMIPHHSSAIMTSRFSHIKDPQVGILTDSIIASQRHEILLMKSMLERLESER